MSFLWIIFSYLLGSFPSGYLISRTSGKDILKIGWRKTSGSNVFRNVGKWQGALTGILDVLKGYLAVFGAQRLGLPLEIQIFSGVAAVTGHNWSCFLKFAGGRGIGTFVGAFLVLAPKILGFSLIPLLFLTIIWNAAIGTLLFLATAIILAIYFNQFEIAGVFTIFSLVPIFIKRLSPIADLWQPARGEPRPKGREEIKKAENKKILIRNRLLFDNDESCLKLRIKQLVKKGPKGNPTKIRKIIKPLAAPILLPPKIGWKAAKFGVKVAKKPIERLISRPSEKVVTEIGIEDLKKMMLAASKKIVFHQEAINKINVWPVADKDTGYNLAATLLGVEGVIGQKKYSSIRKLTRDIKEAAMINARGNAGMIYTGYLMKVLDGIKHLESINGLRLALAMRKGIKAAYLSIADPVEGTILDVIKAAGGTSYQVAKIKKEENIIKILEEGLKSSQKALAETKEKLEALKKADVVDAGALGFVKILEAWMESLKGITPVLEPEVKPPILEPKPEKELEFRYEVISNLKKEDRTEVERLKEKLVSLGSSLDIVELEDKIKFHIHTNFPEKVKEKIKDFEILEWQVEDMSLQIARVTKKKPLGVVVDQIADLPQEFLEKYQIEEIPFKTSFPDGEVLTKENLYPKMREALKTGRPLPTTSQPSFQDFLSVYQKALEKFEKILVITVTAKLSGTYSAARIARSMLKKPTKLNITVFDSFTGEVGEGLIALKVQELISKGKKLEEILETLKQFCPQVKLLACLDDFRYVVSGGRVKIPSSLIPPISLIQKIGIRPMIGLKKGKVKFFGIRLGKNMAKILAKEIEKQSKSKEIKVAIAHADNKKAAEDLKRELEKKPKIKVLFISSVSPVVGTHAGPGTLIAAFHPIDPV